MRRPGFTFGSIHYNAADPLQEVHNNDRYPVQPCIYPHSPKNQQTAYAHNIVYPGTLQTNRQPSTTTSVALDDVHLS